MSVNPTSHRIRSISVIGGFLDGARFDLVDGLNCFIGARGTGKTTALEFVRYALDTLPGREDQPSERRRIESLVERNLAGGRVEIAIETKDGLAYIISRSVGDEPIVLTADRQPTEITLKGGSVFRADIFSQNEVESIADRTMSQLALLDNFEMERIAELDSRLDHVRSALTANANQIVPLQARIAALSEELGTLVGVEERLKKFAVAGGQDAATINEAHTLKALRDRERRNVTTAHQVLQDLSRQLSELQGTVTQQASSLEDRDVAKGPNGGVVQEAIQRLASCGAEVDQLLKSARERIAVAVSQVAAVGTRLVSQHKQQEIDFRSLIEKYQHAQGQAAERAQLERRRNDLLAKARQRQQVSEQLAGLETARRSQLQRLSELWDERFAVRQGISERINSHLAPAIRVSVRQFGNPERYQRLLEDGLKNARIKHLIVAQKLANAFWPGDLAATIRRRDTASLIEKAELNPDQGDKIVASLSNSPLLFELETVELLDEPRIELKDGATYKNSLSLSTGQKCTAILPILLLDSENPLLVDQPEDNLDNRFIFEAVVDSIKKAKTRRQMIFVTHNPNIPVLGDAERVFVLDSDGASARKANEGTVDECKSDIVTLLEGGEDAFKARKCRYAY